MSEEVEVRVRVGRGRWKTYRVPARYARLVLGWSVEGNRAYYDYCIDGSAGSFKTIVRITTDIWWGRHG